MIDSRTWVVVADNARIRIFLNLANSQRLFPVFGGIFDPELQDDWHAGQPLAKQVAEFVEKGAADSQFDQLVLIAPPLMLKDLRGHLGPKAAKFVAAELGKDLTQLPQGELTVRLHEALAV